MDLRKGSVLKLFIKYLLPSVAGTLSIGILIFIDTLFIGRGIGSLGLAALTTASSYVYTLFICRIVIRDGRSYCRGY